ncbi:hemopexin repeat-containing protein, partial [Kibdelosporangium lantanae]
VRYSTRDYGRCDAGYPRPLSDNWWNLPPDLVRDDSPFGRIDAVFTGSDGRTYLFAGDQFVVFDTKHRWWSPSRSLAQQWDSLPFERVDSGFVGKDGRTYLFSGTRYVRYSSRDYSRIDDRYPAPVTPFWGHVVNDIARTGAVDAALVASGTETVDGVDVTRTWTYLFCGDQYVRYLAPDDEQVEDGYPKVVSASLATEPRMRNLGITIDHGVDAAFADR